MNSIIRMVNLRQEEEVVKPKRELASLLPILVVVIIVRMSDVLRFVCIVSAITMFYVYCLLVSFSF